MVNPCQVFFCCNMTYNIAKVDLLVYMYSIYRPTSAQSTLYLKFKFARFACWLPHSLPLFFRVFFFFLPICLFSVAKPIALYSASTLITKPEWLVEIPQTAAFWCCFFFQLGCILCSGKMKLCLCVKYIILWVLFLSGCWADNVSLLFALLAKRRFALGHLGRVFPLMKLVQRQTETFSHCCHLFTWHVRNKNIFTFRWRYRHTSQTEGFCVNKVNKPSLRSNYLHEHVDESSWCMGTLWITHTHSFLLSASASQMTQTANWLQIMGAVKLPLSVQTVC